MAKTRRTGLTWRKGTEVVRELPGATTRELETVRKLLPDKGIHRPGTRCSYGMGGPSAGANPRMVYGRWTVSRCMRRAPGRARPQGEL